MEGSARISPAVLAQYAADAAQEVPGVRGLVESRFPRRGAVRVTNEDGRLAIEVHVSVDWGTPIPTVARGVQASVADYLGRTTASRPARVDVVVDQIGPGQA
ncbi:MAG TPA: Asp23/Gls24 family envelope stress response protein [Gaiellaceae bacterium]|nr:Asp23/Gls24 family envelope stress response protein [Gaiellaceae bacterium]